MGEPARLSGTQQAFAIVGAVILVALVIRLIYGRRLREDYAALWFGFSILIFVFAIWQEGLRFIARALDALTLTAPVFLLTILFLILIAIHFSVELSRTARRVSSLAQRIALLESAPPEGTAGDTRTDRSAPA